MIDGHPRSSLQLRRHAAEQKLRRIWAARSGVALEALERDKVYRNTHGKCVHCHRPVPERGDWHVAHRIPLAAGGPNTYDNAGPAHPECNVAEGRAAADAR